MDYKGPLMVRVYGFLMSIILTLILFPSISIGQDKTGDLFKGVLFRSLFSSEPFRSADLDSAAFSALSDTLRKRITVYAERREKFVSRIETPNPPPGFELTVLLTKRRMIEKGICSLVSVPGVEKEAAGYAQEAKLYYEWEGQSDGPLDEAKYAETFLRASALKPYLLLFLMHRYRCAYECLITEKDAAGAKEASVKYQTFLKLARAQPDPLVGFIAEDMDRISGNIYEDTRYTGGVAHP